MLAIKVFYIVLGSISLALGVVGVFLPGLPTTPFLLLTAYCYARGSKKFHDWFVSTKLYKKHLESFVQKRSMTLRTKWSILILATFMLIFPLIFVKPLFVKAIIVLVILFKYYYFFFQIKTIPESSND